MELSDDEADVSPINNREKWNNLEKPKSKTKFQTPPSVISGDSSNSSEDESENKMVADSSDDDDFDFFSTKRKKAKKVKPVKDEDEDVSIEKLDGSVKDDSLLKNDGDYPYDVLLNNFYQKFYTEFPDKKSNKVYKIPPPEVRRMGGKAIIWNNFPKVCKILNRDQEHIKTFFLKELAAVGSLDIKSRFMIKGRYSQDNVESLLKKYIRLFVTCKNCKQPETVLYKKKRLIYLKCNRCFSEQTVEVI